MTSPPLLILLLTTVSALLYLGYAVHYGSVGFPLDDAWIHQTYARNIAWHHQFAYNPGNLSAGSTSPLWTLFLVPSYALGIDHRLWTYLLGAIFLALTGWTAQKLSSFLFPEDPLSPMLTAGFCLLEWHLAWAAFSGMETILFVFLSLLALERHLAGGRPFLSGAIVGLLTLTRPEGAMLLLLLVLDMAWRRKVGSHHLSWREVAAASTLMLVGFALPMAPYVTYNTVVAGQVFPNTFYAKQAEYRELMARFPLWVRWAQVAAVTLVGAQVLLIPGCLYAVFTIFKLRQRHAVLPLVWWSLLVTAYAVRLPVTYQHGRYLIPTIPVAIIYGVWGTNNLRPAPRILRRVLLISIPLLLILFWLRGAEQYARDVRIIDSELSGTGRWLRDNTPADALIGAHDIGAIGYFSERALVDTAGLVSPEVIPFIRDEERLLAHLEQRNVGYIAIFPSWYPLMAGSPQLRAVHRSTSPWIVQAGGDNMVVYETLWNHSQ